MTFNHKKFIGDCIEGILMQKTTFPVQVLIHDDASTDNTIKILKEYESKYPGILTVYYQESNTFSEPNKHELRKEFFDLIKGKYTAVCEGDDHWVHPLKLQNQVNFMEVNPDCSMVFTGCEIRKPSGERKVIRYPNLKKVTPNEYLIKNYFMTTASLLINSSVPKNAPFEKWMSTSFAGDFILRYRALTMGNIGYINEITTVYNKGTEGSWSKRKLSKKMILKEYSDNLRGLYFLHKKLDIDVNILKKKTVILRKDFYYKAALLKENKVEGLLFLILNYRYSSLKYIGAYVKGIFIS